MSTLINVQIICDGDKCKATFPKEPTPFNTVKGVRKIAREDFGWKCYALHGQQFQDRCPACVPERIKRKGNNQ